MKTCVIIPTYNEAKEIARLVKEIRLQNLDVLVVDDGSSDATPRILATAARHDRRIQIITREGGGLVAALNAGLEACRAPLLARLDGDDICHPRRLEQQAAYLGAHPDIGLVASNFRHFPRTGLKQGMIDYEFWQN